MQFKKGFCSEFQRPAPSRQRQFSSSNLLSAAIFTQGTGPVNWRVSVPKSLGQLSQAPDASLTTYTAAAFSSTSFVFDGDMPSGDQGVQPSFLKTLLSLTAIRKVRKSINYSY